MHTAGPPDPRSLPPGQLARRQRIVRAALRSLARSHHEAVRISEVAADASVALGTLYRYFASKEHLLAAAFLEWQSSLDTEIAVVAACDGDSEAERFRTVFARVVGAFERQPQLLRVMVMLEATSDPHARAIYDSLGSAFRTSVEPVVGPLDGDRGEVFVVVNAVLDSALRAWISNRMTIAEVHARVDGAIALLYRGAGSVAAPSDGAHGRGPQADALRQAKAPATSSRTATSTRR